jgi:tetratricopeptide (TPR) repeat protein
MTVQRKNETIVQTDSPKAEAQRLADQARRARLRSEALDWARKALELDGECTDAQVLLAREEAIPPRQLVTRLRIIVDRAEARLGVPFLRESRDRLWDIPETHPYLRARQALAEALERAGKPSQGIPHLKELLRIDPEDHLGVRCQLVRCLLAANDLKTLGTLLRDNQDASSAFFAWASVLERIRSGAGKGAEQALAAARKVNPFVEEFLTGQRKLPKQIPDEVTPGSPEEAAQTLKLFGEAWSNDRESMYWLFRHRG